MKKKLFLAVVSIVLSVAANAQGIEIYKDGKLYQSFSGTEYKAVMTKTVTPVIDGHEYVDLGLPSGTLWATMNVGATTETGYGNYFAWGETSQQSNNAYTWASYKYCNGASDKMTKYCTNSNSGTVDNKTRLDASDDAATVNWGTHWCIPTKAQWDELISTCTKTYDATKKGYTFTHNGKSIFLPMPGWRGSDGTASGKILNEGTYGDYWSCDLAVIMNASSNRACDMQFDNGSTTPASSHSRRFIGLSVRAVVK